MKQDYLWDKTGNDSGIIELEKKLSVFRSKEQAAPSLVAMNIKNEKRPSRKLFQLGFAFATCTAIIFVSAAAWLQISNNREIAGEMPKAQSIQTDDSPKTTPTRDLTGPVLVKNPVERDPGNKNVRKESSGARVNHSGGKTKKNHYRKLKNKRKSGFPSEVNTTAKTEVILTKEERYAYEQLMLGLSITSSNLKLVRDKARGIQEKAAVRKDGI